MHLLSTLWVPAFILYSYPVMYWFIPGFLLRTFVRLACDRTEWGWRASALIMERVAGQGGVGAPLHEHDRPFDRDQQAFLLDVQLRQDWGYNLIRPLAGTLPDDFHEIAALLHMDPNKVMALVKAGPAIA